MTQYGFGMTQRWPTLDPTNPAETPNLDYWSQPILGGMPLSRLVNLFGSLASSIVPTSIGGRMGSALSGMAQPYEAANLQRESLLDLARREARGKAAAEAERQRRLGGMLSRLTTREGGYAPQEDLSGTPGYTGPGPLNVPPVGYNMEGIGQTALPRLSPGDVSSLYDLAGQHGGKALMDYFTNMGQLPSEVDLQTKRAAEAYPLLQRTVPNAIIQGKIGDKGLTYEFAQPTNDYGVRAQGAQELYPNDPRARLNAVLNPLQQAEAASIAGTATPEQQALVNQAHPGRPDALGAFSEPGKVFTPNVFLRGLTEPYTVPGGEDKNITNEQLTMKALREKLGRQPTNQEIVNALQQQKLDLAKAQEPGKIRIIEAGAKARGEAYGAGRFGTFFDAANGNRPIQMSFGDYRLAEQSEPGRFLPASASERALNKTSLLEEIRGASHDLSRAIDNMPELSATQAAQIAMAIRSPDPRSTWNQMMSRGFAASLSPQQIDYVTALLSLRESSFALRSVLGAGQGSDLLREAIAQTVPSATTPSKDYARRQLETLRVQIDRLERGIPSVPLRPAPQPPVSTGTRNTASPTADSVLKKWGLQ